MSRKIFSDKRSVLLGTDNFDKVINTNSEVDYISIVSDVSVKEWERFLTSRETGITVAHHGSYSLGTNLQVSGSSNEFDTPPFYPTVQPTIHETNIKLGELSALSISKNGVLDEEWDKIENVSAIIVDFSNEYTTLECLIDESKKTYERRIFSSGLLKGVVRMAIGDLILIKIFQRAGELKFKFVSGKGIVRSELFQKNGAIEEVFKKIPKGKYDRHYKGEPR